jgi:cytochrome P450
MQVPIEIANTIVDPEAYADGKRVDEAFIWLRREAPMAVVQPTGFRPFRAVTRFHDIQEVERRGEDFHAGDTFANALDLKSEVEILKMTGGSPHPVRSLVQMDNPDHFNYRRLTQSWFLPQNLKNLEGRIRELARETVDRMAAHGDRCDFAKDVAFLYPLRVIMEVLGVPKSDEALMLKLTQEMFGSTDPELNRSRSVIQSVEERFAASQGTIAEMMAYFTDLSESRRKVPRDDIATVLATAQIDGKPLGVLEALSYYIIVATAGHDTTSSTTAGGLWALLENPAQLAKVKADPSLIPGLVEESIRWVTSVKHFMRSATRDTDVNGIPVAKGDWLMLCYPSGNRDEAVFERPFEFDIERTPNKHVAFGYGAHVCLGQHLARLEMRALWEELLPRLDHIELDGQPKNTVASFVCGPKSVPVRFKMH